MQSCVRSLRNIGFKISRLSAFSIEFCKHVFTSAEAILRLKLAKMNDPNNSFLWSRPTQDVSRRVGVVASEHRRRDVVNDGDDVFRRDGASHDGSADPWAADRRDQQARVHLEVLARVEVPLSGPPGTTHHRILAFRASRHFRYFVVLARPFPVKYDVRIYLLRRCSWLGRASFKGPSLVQLHWRGFASRPETCHLSDHAAA